MSKNQPKPPPPPVLTRFELFVAAEWMALRNRLPINSEKEAADIAKLAILNARVLESTFLEVTHAAV